jgi:hypothetical protein
MAAHTALVSPINAPSRGRRVQISINDLKSTIDGALADGGRLMADMLNAGQEAGVLPQTSQRAIERMLECLKAGIEMRALAIATHHDMRKIMGKMDLDVVGFGDVGPSPPSGELVGDTMATN